VWFRLVICLTFIQVYSYSAYEHFMHGNFFEVTENIRNHSKVLNESEQKDYLINKHRDSELGETIEIYGVELTEYNSRLVSLLSTLSGNSPKVSINKNCDNLFCIADEIFGKDLGVYYLYILDRYNINLSPYDLNLSSTDGLKRDELFIGLFQREELQSFVIALSLIPDVYYESFRNKPAKRVNSYAQSGQNVLANSRMHYYSPWLRSSTIEKISTILHEIGHNVADMTYSKADNNNVWNGFSGWYKRKENGETKWFHNSGKFVSRYSETSPVEDFAEAFTAFIINAEFLKKTSIKKFNYIKNEIFYGQDYTLEIDSLMQLKMAKEKLREGIESLDDKKIDSLVFSCFDDYMEFTFRDNKNSFYKCMLMKIVPDKIILSPVFQSRDIYSSLNTHRTFQNIVDKLVQRFMKLVRRDLDQSRIELCSESPLYIFDSDSYLFNKRTKWITYDSGEKLCRWVNVRLRVLNQEVTKENFKNALEVILKQRLKSI